MERIRLHAHAATRTVFADVERVLTRGRIAFYFDDRDERVGRRCGQTNKLHAELVLMKLYWLSRRILPG